MPLPDYIFQLHGWCPREKGERMYNLVKDTRAELTVELGVYGGRSFIPMVYGHKDGGHGKAVGVDPWATSDSIANYPPSDPNYEWWDSIDHNNIYNIFQAVLAANDLTAFCEIHRKKSTEVVDMFEDGSIDVLHQDGNHSVESSVWEVNAFANKVKPGGYWIMDDTDWDTTKEAQAKLLRHGYDLVEDYTKWRLYRRPTDQPAI